MIQITPSLPAQSFDELHVLATILAPYIPMFQVDIVDGEFVPLTSWPFTEEGNPKELLLKLSEFISRVPIEVDCMVMNPENYLDTFVALHVASVIVHMRSTEAYEAIIEHARAHGYRIGFALTNDVPLTELEPFIPQIDFVQVMGIAHVGKQGQPFDERTLDTLRTLRASYPELPLVVDGAVNKDTIKLLCDAGATRLAPGSAISKDSDPISAYKQLSMLVAE
jgi:ribulose-phosphate 3-epimerase